MARVLSVLAECPYCSGKLPHAPTREHPCPSCKNVFYVLRGEDGNLYAVTKDELNPAAHADNPSAKGCIFCGGKLPEAANYCPKCGKRQHPEIKAICQACGSTVNEEMDFCTRCGTKIPRS